MYSFCLTKKAFCLNTSFRRTYIATMAQHGELEAWQEHFLIKAATREPITLERKKDGTKETYSADVTHLANLGSNAVPLALNVFSVLERSIQFLDKDGTNLGYTVCLEVDNNNKITPKVFDNGNPVANGYLGDGIATIKLGTINARIDILNYC